MGKKTARTILEAAKLLGVHDRTVSNLIAQEGYQKDANGFFDIERGKALLAIRAENYLTKTKKHPSKENRIPDDLRAHETRYKKARADREELKAALEKGTQVDLGQVRQETIAREMAFKKAFMNLPKNMATRLMGCGSKEIEAVLTKYVSEGFRKLVQKGKPRMPDRFTGESVKEKKKRDRR